MFFLRLVFFMCLRGRGLAVGLFARVFETCEGVCVVVWVCCLGIWIGPEPGWALGPLLFPLAVSMDGSGSKCL